MIKVSDNVSSLHQFLARYKSRQGVVEMLEIPPDLATQSSGDKNGTNTKMTMRR